MLFRSVRPGHLSGLVDCTQKMFVVRPVHLSDLGTCQTCGPVCAPVRPVHLSDLWLIARRRKCFCVKTCAFVRPVHLRTTTRKKHNQDALNFVTPRGLQDALNFVTPRVFPGKRSVSVGVAADFVTPRGLPGKSFVSVGVAADRKQDRLP